MKKIMSLVITIIMTMNLVACGMSTTPESAVKSFCNAMKELNLAEANKYLESSGQSLQKQVDDNDTKDVTTEMIREYLLDWNSDLTYTFKSCTIDGKDDSGAVVLVDFEYVDASDIMSETLTEYVAQVIGNTFNSEDVDAKLLDSIFMEKAECTSVETKNITVRFDCVKEENEWKICSFDSDTAQEILNIYSCGIQDALVEFYVSLAIAAGVSNSVVNGNDTSTTENLNWHDVPVGECVQLSSVEMSVDNYSEEHTLQSKYFEDLTAQKGTKFIVVNITVENKTASPFEIRGSIFNLYDNQGRQYGVYNDAFLYFDETFIYTTISPNIPTTGVLVYNVPDDSEDCYLVAGRAGTNDAYRFYIE